jgi:hypothetical protein
MEHPLFSPDLAVTDTAIFVAGNGAWEPEHRIGNTRASRDSMNADTTRLRIRQIGGPELPVPAGGHEMPYPELAAGADGLHLVWGEPHPDSLQKQRASEKPIWILRTNVYHTRYSEGGWSVPTPVLSSDRFKTVGGWGNPDAKDESLRPAQGGGLHLALELELRNIRTLLGAPDPKKLFYFRWLPEKGRWRGPAGPLNTVNLKVRNLSARGSAVSMEGTTYLAYVGDEPNTTYVIRSPNRGQTWTAPTVVWKNSETSSETSIVRSSPLLLSNGEGMLYLGKEPTSSGTAAISPSSFQLFFSEDGGRSWSEPSVLTFDRFRILSFRAVVGPRGRIHAVFYGTAGDGIGAALCHAAWSREGGWSRPRFITESDESPDEYGYGVWRHDLAVGPNGDKLYVVFPQQIGDAYPRGAYMTYEFQGD